MRILIVGPAAEIGGKARVRVGDRILSVLDLLQVFDGPHDLFTCPHLEQAIRYLTGLPFDLIVAGGELGRKVLQWADGHVSALQRIPRGYAYDAEALVQTSALKVRSAPLSADTIRQLVTRERVSTGKIIDAATLLMLSLLRDQAQQIIANAQLELDRLNDQKRQAGEDALRTLGLDPASGEFLIDEQTGDVTELKVI